MQDHKNPGAAQARFAALFNPQTIAVAGASASQVTAGNRFIRLLRHWNFRGEIYAIHPRAETIEGVPAFRSLAETPRPVDYAYITIPAAHVPELLAAARGRVAFAQVMASIAPDDLAAWERELLGAAKSAGVRLIGPNCMGTHSPRGGYTFMEGAGLEPGDVGVAAQSGGLGMDILRRGQASGLRFSGLVTLGNSIDVTPVDMLDYFLDDPETRAIGLYIEDVKDGARFRALLDANAGAKPVVLLVGGLTTLGGAAAASHTGAMTGGGRAWEALARQTGAILTFTLDDFLETLQTCAWLTPKPTSSASGIVLFGNGGGTSVLASDAVARAGFGLTGMPPAALAEIAELRLPPGASVVNPIDLPASVLQEQQGCIAGHILEIVRRHAKPHAVIAHLNLPVIMGYRHIENFMPNLIEALLKIGSSATAAPHLVLALRSDGSEEVDAWRRTFRSAATARRVPCYDELPQAVSALSRFRYYEDFIADRLAGSYSEGRREDGA